MRGLIPALILGGLIVMGSALLAYRGGSAQTTPASAGPPAGHAMVLSFAEEFDRPSLDTTTWRTVYAPRSHKSAGIEKRSLYGNAERQLYFDRDYLGLGIDPFRVADGVLTITAAPLDARARAAVMGDLARVSPQLRQTALARVAYSSGLISTRDGFSQRYGYFEIRARWSAGKGIWPAFWLLPADGSWPPEIDVVEAHGDKPETAFQTVHSTLTKPQWTARTATVPGSTQQFHRYGALWLPDRVDYYVDGRKTASIPAPADLTKPMHLLANLAIGGHWPGDPDARTRFPATMEIDYVRVWRFRDPPGTAR